MTSPSAPQPTAQAECSQPPAARTFPVHHHPTSSAPDPQLRLETLLVRSGTGTDPATGAITTPIHLSTAYEDVVVGLRPTAEGGFAAAEGVFARFCRRAAADPGRDYVFIIDEINRANISKAFGELLMLIEAEHRGEALRLPVSGELLSVPKRLHIIGMMNTADRGLALIDYALRRRFAFFEMRPALDHPGFLRHVEAVGSSRLEALVDVVRRLNQRIAEDEALGSGFQIGHSYLCLPAAGPENPGALVLTGHDGADVNGLGGNTRLEGCLLGLAGAPGDSGDRGGNGEGLPAVADLLAAEVLGEALGVDGGRGDDDLEVGALGQ